MPPACFLTPKPIGCTPRSCPTGSLPAAKAYFVTPPPLGGDTVGRGILDAPFPSRHKHRGISEAWHRRRPGGPSRYNATTFRACRVIPMRATRGAASSAQATDRSLPGRPESSFPPLGLLSPPNPLRWASAGAPITASANGAGGDADPVFASSVQPTAAMSPRFWGVPGAHPRPFLSHRFLSERKRCPGRAGPLREGGILYERATTGRPYGRRAESSRPTEPMVAEANGRIISAPANGETGGQYPLSQKVRRDAAPSWRGKSEQIVNCGGPLAGKRPFLIAFWGAEV